MSETKPVAYIDKGALAELEKHPVASATVWSGKASHRFAQAAEPLYPASALTSLMEENERLLARNSEANAKGQEAFQLALFHQSRADAAEARVKELEAKLAEADALIEAQQHDFAQNNIRNAENAHRAEAAEALLKEAADWWEYWDNGDKCAPHWVAAIRALKEKP
jgi:hypothetical protein